MVVLFLQAAGAALQEVDEADGEAASDGGYGVVREVRGFQTDTVRG